jgi:predicted Zn-dependent protease
MTYTRNLIFALALALGWIIGDPAVALGPKPDRHVEVQLAIEWVDSLIAHLRAHPNDVDAMEQLAAMYLANESYDAAIGPLARGLQLDPSRRSLWSALDTAIEKSGHGKMTDKELTEKAAAFVESVEMWGHGC